MDRRGDGAFTIRRIAMGHGNLSDWSLELEVLSVGRAR
jgi:hypothetical protein